MKIILQSLKQIKYDVDILNESSVLELKKLVEAKHGFDHSVLKLLHKGRILEDSKLLSDYTLNDGTPLIMMNVKAKATNVSVPNTSTQVITNEEVKKSEIIIDAPNKQSKTSTLSSKEYTEEIKQLQEMGFDKEQSEKSLKASKGNLQLAIEYLYSGNQIHNNQPDYEEDEDYPNGEYEEGEDDEDDMEEDAEAFEIEDIASVIKVLSQSDPSQLQNILANVASHNPELLEIIQENEPEFKILVAQPITSKDQQVYDNYMKRNNGNLYGITGNLSGTNNYPVSNNIANNNSNTIITNSLSQQDKEAVQRLKSLGFSEEDCIEAYLACGKDENMAACYLFDNK